MEELLITYAEFKREHSHFELIGGPGDGERIPTDFFPGWPVSVMRAGHPGARTVSAYRLRDGAPHCCDYVGELKC